MKPHLLKVALGHDYSFSVRNDVGPYFYNRLHFHPEVELVYIHRGSGTQFMGSSISRFAPGEMLLVGANLTHMWRCDQEYFTTSSSLVAEASVLHFHPQFLGKEFFSLPENKALARLLQNAERGLRIGGRTKQRAVHHLQRLKEASGAERIIRLLMILNLLAVSGEWEYLSAQGVVPTSSVQATGRLDTLYQYMLTHFSERVSLEEAASIIHLSPKSFCRYFKQHTGRTFSSFLIELRISHACKLLQQEDKTIAAVCYESGFNNVSNFNRLFKAAIGKTPLQYKREAYLPGILFK